MSKQAVFEAVDRSQDVSVQASRWRPGQYVEGVWGPFEGAHRCIACLPEGSYEVVGPAVVTPEGQVKTVRPGDWVVPDVDGGHARVFSPEEFRQRYDLIGVRSL